MHAQADRPAHYVAKSLQDSGVEVVPVPVYYPDKEVILGQKVHRKLADIEGLVDIVDVFRRAEDLAPHLDDILSINPKVPQQFCYCWIPSLSPSDLTHAP